MVKRPPEISRTAFTAAVNMGVVNLAGRKCDKCMGSCYHTFGKRVHLLSCLLARIWEGSEASAAIWVQMVLRT